MFFKVTAQYLNLSVVCPEEVDQLLLRFCMRLISASFKGSRYASSLRRSSSGAMLLNFNMSFWTQTWGRVTFCLFF